ncbi:MAG: response regulator [Desulfonatronovibrio sp.]
MKKEQNQELIMIVDDTPDNLGLLSEILHTRGYAVSAFPSGKMALNAASQNPPDLVLLDIMMPEMDGFQVCRQLKSIEHLQDIPVIFLSALEDASNKIKAFSQGGVDYVTKPFHEEEVLARVEAQLRIRSLQRRLQEQNKNLEKTVEQRTKELSQANAKLREIDSLKDDFFRMMSHEIRTPANGILGIGEILIEQLPESDDRQTFVDMFRRSGKRLRNLIDDALMLGSVDKAVDSTEITFTLSDLLSEVCADFPEVKISHKDDCDPQHLVVNGEHTLLTKALRNMTQLAGYFCHDNCSLNIECQLKGNTAVDLVIYLDSLALNKPQADEFFKLESVIRGSSQAQEMGLAPVVAHRILSAMGGDMQIVKNGENKGFLTARIPVNSEVVIAEKS